jgi:hypothetical protein
MCKYLNLDYDGDEVHLIAIGSTEAIQEMSRVEPFYPLDKFSTKYIADYLHQTFGGKKSNKKLMSSLIDDKLHSKDKVPSYDYMYLSTLSITELNTVEVENKLFHSTCRQNAPWSQMREVSKTSILLTLLLRGLRMQLQVN